MNKSSDNQIAELSLQDRQLLETCGQLAFHRAKKAKLILNTRSLNNQIKPN